MFSPAGIDIALKAAPGAPGRMTFDWDSTGNPRFDNNRAHAVHTQLLSWRRGRPLGATIDEGGYYWDTSGLRGSLLWTVRYNVAATGSALKAYAEDALQVLIQENIIASATANPVRLAQGKWRLDVTWTLPSGNSPPGISVGA